MKRTKTNIDFPTDTVTILGSTQKLLFTSSGYYCVRLGHHICISVVEEDSSMLTSESVLFGEEFKEPSVEKGRLFPSYISNLVMPQVKELRVFLRMQVLQMRSASKFLIR